MSSQKLRKELYELLGDLPPRNRKISGKKVSQQTWIYTQKLTQNQHPISMALSPFRLILSDPRN
jgi:hypothetical protein